MPISADLFPMAKDLSGFGTAPGGCTTIGRGTKHDARLPVAGHDFGGWMTVAVEVARLGHRHAGPQGL